MEQNNVSIHSPLPGKVLVEEFMKPMHLSTYRIAKDTGLAATAVSEIMRGKRRISIETAIIFATYFGNKSEYWLGIQNAYDLDKARQLMTDKIKSVHPLQGK
jgi:addiction module HigA family antidote